MNVRDAALTIALSATTTLVTHRLLLSEASTLPSAVAAVPAGRQELVVDRLVVRNELIVSDTERPWDDGFEDHQIPRGVVIRSLAATDGHPQTAGMWLRSRLIKTEIDDPFDDRFHAINRDGTMFRAPGHISWNVWLDGAWRQMVNIQGEGLENNEVPFTEWNGGNHPGRLRLQSFRPHHTEPLTDVITGQGMMSVGGGGYGGGGLPYPSEVLQLWGGTLETAGVPRPDPPRVNSDDNSGPHTYALMALGPQGQRSARSETVRANGLAKLSWGSPPGADAFVVIRDGQELPEILRIEGSEKHWTDQP